MVVIVEKIHLRKGIKSTEMERGESSAPRYVTFICNAKSDTTVVSERWPTQRVVVLPLIRARSACQER